MLRVSNKQNGHRQARAVYTYLVIQEEIVRCSKLNRISNRANFPRTRYIRTARECSYSLAFSHLTCK